MKRIVPLVLGVLLSSGAFGQDISIQDQLQDATKTMVVLKGTSTGLTILGSVLTIFGAWELQNGAVPVNFGGGTIVYPSQGGYVAGVGLIGTGVSLFAVAAGVSFFGDLQMAQALELAGSAANPHS